MSRLVHVVMMLAVCMTAGPTTALGQVATSTARATTSLCPLGSPYNVDNVFARTIRGELPAPIVFQDERVIAFVPLGWDYPGHVLVVPKGAIRNLYDMSEADLVAVNRLVKRLSVAQQRAFGATGFTVVQNNARNQDVCHAHFHVIPDTPKDPHPNATTAERDLVAARLRAALPE